MIRILHHSQIFKLLPFFSLAILLLFSCKEEEDDELLITRTNSNQTAQDTSITHTTKNSFVDSRDGNRYTFITIGEQVWMQENLKYLPAVVGSDSSSLKKPLYYVYGYQGTDTNAAKRSQFYMDYGVLYNFAAATIGGVRDPELSNRVQGICPEGWHLPSDIEWTALSNFLGGRPVAGGKLKATDTTHWKSPNAAATNEFGFSGLGGGFRATGGSFEDWRTGGYWWSSTENGSDYAWFRNMYFSNGDLYRIEFQKASGFCVRCIRD